jgi:TatA/E family protein of Tat protein translocase
MFGISGIELFMILAVALLIFGPEEMPKIGRIIGQGLRMFNDARQQVEDVIQSEILTPEDAIMLKDPLGMKGMKDDFEKTFKQMADPTYKPVPKGSGMRVATDDALEAEMRSTAAAAAPTSGSSTPGAPTSGAPAPAAPASGVPSPVAMAEAVDPDDVASIWGIAPAVVDEAGESDAH